MDKRIFISHSNKDHEVASKICAALEENGIKCWIAPRDIPFGSTWAEEISKAISNSVAFLFLSSGNSNASKQVSREIELAVENGLTIIPIRLDDTQYSDANKYYLATIHCMIEYDAVKIHKLVSDIMGAIPTKEPEEEAPESKDTKKEKKIKKTKKMSPGLKMTLCAFNGLIWATVAAFVFFFTKTDDTLKYVCLALSAAPAFIPLALCHRSAAKRYTVNKTKINLLALATIIGVAGIFGGGYLLDNHLWYTDMDTKYHITLSAPEYMTASDFEAAIGTVKERLDILMGEERYSVSVNGDEIDLILPRDVFGGYDPGNIIKAYVSRAMKLYITTPDFYSDEYTEDFPRQIEVRPDDIESITIKNGSVDGVNPEDFGIETDTYEYIEVILKEDFAAEHAGTFKQYGEKLIFAQDKVEITSGYVYMDTVRGEKENVFYLINTDELEYANETVVYNYTHEPLAGSLSVYIDIAPVWEEIETADKTGKNQCNPADLQGKTVTISYVSSYSDVSEGKWLDTVTQFKNRLDALGTPYAFGKIENNPFSITVRTSTDRMGMPIMRLLMADQFYIQGSYSYNLISSFYGTERYLTANHDEENGGETYVTARASYEEVEKEFAYLSALAADTAEKKIYLTAGYYHMPVLSATADKDSDGKSIVFDEVCLGLNKKFDSETAWIADLIETVYTNSLSADIKLDSYKLDDSENSTEKDFGFSINLDSIQSEIENIDPEGSVSVSGEQLNVYLDLSVDENLPQKMIDTAKVIFEKTDFKNSTFSNLGIYFISEIDDERARIFFTKTVNMLYIGKDYYNDGYIRTYGIFSGGRIERDKEVFLDLIYKDEFFKQYIHEEEAYSSFSY